MELEKILAVQAKRGAQTGNQRGYPITKEMDETEMTHKNAPIGDTIKTSLTQFTNHSHTPKFKLLLISQRKEAKLSTMELLNLKQIPLE